MSGLESRLSNFTPHYSPINYKIRISLKFSFIFTCASVALKMGSSENYGLAPLTSESLLVSTPCNNVLTARPISLLLV